MHTDICLLPEFGWSIKDQHVFGPGSVFQGFIKLKLTQELAEKACKLRIVFHASEIVYKMTRVAPLYNNQLFGSQRVIWKRKSQCQRMSTETETSYPFIVQLPMVNFPPSSKILCGVEGISYHSSFNLTAFLDDADGNNLLKNQNEILYMPLLETVSLKNPMVFNISDHHAQDEHFQVKLPSLDYVPGDNISVYVTGHDCNKKTIESVTLKLLHIQVWDSKTSAYKDKIRSKTMITSSTTKASALPLSSTIEALVEIPLDTIPTFTYGLQFAGSYQLQVSIKYKGMIWSHGTEIQKIPINIGTLGHGIHPPEKIKNYVDFRGVFDHSSDLPMLPVPQFLNQIEYEEALPVYEEITLPPYEVSLT